MKKIYQQALMVTAVSVLFAGAAPLQAAETDDRIQKAFKESFVFKTYLQDDSVKAESKEGVVTLFGTVNQLAHKGLAEETVRSLPGVKNVDNRLELKAEYPADKSNEWLAMNIKASLMVRKNVSVRNTEVHVEEGIVTLRGEAESQAQKELTEEFAYVEGVREIRNEMTVAKDTGLQEKTDDASVRAGKGEGLQEKVDDASITAQVKMALLTHRSTGALKTSVETNQGIVTLGGQAKNAAEKELVTKLASDIRGVNKTVNNMQVAVSRV